jgi:hypothetical protein
VCIVGCDATITLYTNKSKWKVVRLREKYKVSETLNKFILIEHMVIIRNYNQKAKSKSTPVQPCTYPNEAETPDFKTISK